MVDGPSGRPLGRDQWISGYTQAYAEGPCVHGAEPAHPTRPRGEAARSEPQRVPRATDRARGWRRDWTGPRSARAQSAGGCRSPGQAEPASRRLRCHRGHQEDAGHALRQLVLDASVLGRWIFQPNDAVAGALRVEFEAGELTIAVPALVFLELLNVAGRQLRWAVDELTELADRIQKSGFDVLEPDLALVATWVARGLTAYDASYVALAEQLDMPLATGDRLILELAPRLAVPPERA
ncbi:MAG: hypothetical protein DMD49_10570 [Gemmatimonadetes bacterium]|nr:MAG: hypothetical protein DMD49_10570 [Gemmatimonadota bacterium]